ARLKRKAAEKTSRSAFSGPGRSGGCSSPSIYHMRAARTRGGPALANADFMVRFWGVRGSIACPGPGTARYGGNTACVEVRAGGKLFIFDSGSGIRLLGNALMKGRQPRDVDLFFTHTHLDPCHGLPFFAPCYDKRNRIRVWAGHL